MTPSWARSRPRVALAGLAVLLLIIGVTAWAVDGGGAPRPRADRVDPSVSVPELDQLARAAPCNVVQDEQHLAGRNEVARFRAAAVVNCRTGERTYPGAGTWQVLTRQVAVRGLARLLDALVRPDAVTPREQACAAIGYLPLTILLAGSGGHYLHPRAPATTCGGPQAATLRAIAALRWRTVSVTRIQQLASPAAVASGCEMAWKNEAALLAGTLSPAAGGKLKVGRADEALVACVYKGDPVAGSGEFVRAVRLKADRATQLRAALSLPGGDDDCQAQPAFAVVRAAPSSAWVNVELGGCWRVIRNDENPVRRGRADPATVTRLLGRA